MKPMAHFSTYALLALVALLFAGDAVHAQISGVVLDMDTGDPVEGALVTVQATNIQDETGVDGTFSLPGASGAGLVVVAAKKTYFYAPVMVSTPAAGVTIELETVPLQFDTTYEFDPGFCSFCHGDQFDQWETSRMGNTATNTWVYDLYSGNGTADGANGFVYQNDGVNVATDPDGGCAACHQPVSWLKAGGDIALSTDFASPGVPVEDNVLNDFDAAQGVSCDVCHKMADIDTANVNTLGLDPAAITVNLPGPGPLPPQIQYGVLGDVDFFEAAFMRPSYQPQLTNDACAACHQYFNDSDQNGQNDNFEGQTTWSEWASSPYGDPQSASYQTCIDCHTQGFGAEAACIQLQGVIQRDPETVHEMNFKGTDADHLENAVSMTLDVTVVNDVAEVEVNISNLFTGHAVPTGVSIRNVILLVEAIRQEDDLRLDDNLGQEIHPLGGVGDPDQGYYGGLPGKLYGRINMNAMGTEGVLFTESVGNTFTSILPLETDTTTYAFPLPVSTGGTVDVRARLIYRRAWRPLVDAKGWTEEGAALGPGTPRAPLEDLMAPHFGHLMEEAVLDPPIDLGPFMGGGQEFIRGDADGDGQFNGLIDGLRILNFQFSMGVAPPCLESADADGNGMFNGLVDGLYVLGHQFTMGPPPPAPYPACGPDPDPGSSLGCASHPGCP